MLSLRSGCLGGKSSDEIGRKCHIERWMYAVVDLHDEEALEWSPVELITVCSWIILRD